MSLAHPADHVPPLEKDVPLGDMPWVPVGLLLAVATLAGSLWLSMGMGLKACPLCFYQRTFVMAVIGVLAIGMLAGSQHRGILPLLAVPAAAGGVGVAVFHVWLEAAGRLECPSGLWGWGTAPQQSLAAQSLLLIVLLQAALRRGAAGGVPRKATVAAAVLLGVAFSWAAIASTPPPPPAPAKPYEQPLDTCRPPFRSSRV